VNVSEYIGESATFLAGAFASPRAWVEMLQQNLVHAIVQRICLDCLLRKIESWHAGRHETPLAVFGRPGQYFRNTPITRPWSSTDAAGTMMGCMATFDGWRRMLSPSR
jgi:hypothetical protein